MTSCRAVELRFRLIVFGLLCLGTCLELGLFARPALAEAKSIEQGPPTVKQVETLPRLISLNPSLTAIVIRLGAGDTLVGVDEYSAELIKEVQGLPRVGGLFDPSLEVVLALRPDRVLLVAGIDQQNHGAQLERLGIEVEIFENVRFDQVLENIHRLGEMLGRETAASERIAAILETRRAVATAVAGRPKPATLAVVDRSPLFLVGGDTFIDEMLEIVGAKNLARSLGAGYPRASIEWVIGAKPALLLDMTPGSEDGRAFWGRWPSLPAVEAGRVLTLDASRISLPGPELGRALRELAVAVHGDAIDREITEALSMTPPPHLAPDLSAAPTRPTAKNASNDSKRPAMLEASHP